MLFILANFFAEFPCWFLVMSNDVFSTVCEKLFLKVLLLFNGSGANCKHGLLYLPRSCIYAIYVSFVLLLRQIESKPSG